ncbi:unnamed protein product [Urochloa humidicola]
MPAVVLHLPSRGVRFPAACQISSGRLHQFRRQELDFPPQFPAQISRRMDQLEKQGVQQKKSSKPSSSSSRSAGATATASPSTSLQAAVQAARLHILVLLPAFQWDVKLHCIWRF